MKGYEEEHEVGAGWSWFLVALLAGLVLAWGLFCFKLVKDGPRRWNFGELPDAPSQSVYSTQEPSPNAAPPPQSPQLPEAEPWKGAAK